MRGIGRAKNRESEHGAISRISFEDASLPPATAWSGYGCKPAAWLTRSASLLMTQSGPNQKLSLPSALIRVEPLDP